MTRKRDKITDVGYEKPPIDLLIRADYAGKIYTGRIQHLNSGLVAVETCLVWVLMRKFHQGTIKDFMANVVTSLLIHSDNISNLRELEDISINDPGEYQSKIEIEMQYKITFEDSADN